MKNYYISVLKKYAEFNGRSSRAEYWYFFLFNFIIALVLGFIEGFLGIFPAASESVLANLYSLFIIIPNIAVGVRGMHDVNKSGWFLFIPFYSLLLVLRDGTKGDNQYGPDPKKVEVS